MKQKFNPLIIIVLVIVIISAYWLFYTGQQVGKNLTVCTRLPRVKIISKNPYEIAPNTELKWKNHIILKVYFEAGINDFTESIIREASEWSKYCGIKFKITDLWSDADIKVTFKRGGYASAIGIESIQQEYNTKYSMYLQGIDTLRNKEEFHRVILHEFGHALGIEHELSKPSAAIPWNKKEVYNYYQYKFKWSNKDVDENIFKQLKPANKEYAEFDSTSIMVYGIKPPLTVAPYIIPWPKGLSKTDIIGISKWYPK